MPGLKETKICHLFKTGKCSYLTSERPGYLIVGIKDGKVKIGYNQCGKFEYCGFYPIYGLEEFFADYTVIDTVCNGNKNLKTVAEDSTEKF